MTHKKRIVIVGAGITGVSIAWHLAHREFDVTLVEQDMPVSGATGSAFGWLTGVVKYATVRAMQSRNVTSHPALAG